MKLYWQAYKYILKKDIMLLIIACFMLFFTFGLWLGIPVWVISVYIAEYTNSILLVFIIVPISIGIFFSLYFMPINIKVARRIAHIKKSSTWKILLKIESVFVLMIVIIFILIVFIILLLNQLL